jgi:hypothetical protein
MEVAAIWQAPWLLEKAESTARGGQELTTLMSGSSKVWSKPRQLMHGMMEAHLQVDTSPAQFSAPGLAYKYERLAPFKIPKHVRSVDAFPKNTSRKILNRELRAATVGAA